MSTIHSPARAEDVGILVPADVRDVCLARGLTAYLATAVRLATATFVGVQDLHFEVDVDPDTDERRVVLNVTADASADELMDRYRAFIAQWVRAAPPEAREWVRLSVHALRDE